MTAGESEQGRAITSLNRELATRKSEMRQRDRELADLRRELAELRGLGGPPALSVAPALPLDPVGGPKISASRLRGETEMEDSEPSDPDSLVQPRASTSTRKKRRLPSSSPEGAAEDKKRENLFSPVGDVAPP